MKNTITFLFLCFTATVLSAQEELNTQLAEAKSQYTSGNLEETRFALQQSLNELYILMGQKILDEMPDQLGELPALEDEDAYNGYNLGFTGVYIDRTYQNEAGDQSVQVTLIHDSPLLSGLNSFLATPLMAMASGRKMIKLNGYKTVLEDENSDEGTFVLNTPFGQSLLTMTFDGFDNENEVVGLANQLPIATIVKIAQ